MGFCLCFCFCFWRFAPESVWKNSLDVRSVFFWVRSLFLWFFRRRRVFCFFERDTDQVVTGHPRTRTCFAGSFSFLCPAAFVCFARFGRASCFSAFFSGCHSGPRAFLGFSLNLWGLSSLAPSEALFLGREAARVFRCFSCLVFLFPLLFCGYTFSRKARPVISRRPAAGDLARPLAQVRAGGLPYLGGGLAPSFCGILTAVFVSQRVTGTLGRAASRAFCLGRGRFFCPFRPVFTLHVFVPAPGFFFSAFEACEPRWIADAHE